VDFTRANLRGAVLRECQMSSANFKDAAVDGMVIFNSNQEETNLTAEQLAKIEDTTEATKKKGTVLS
jgi:uncharacterized protein YjbI with pentapeptide repeats